MRVLLVMLFALGCAGLFAGGVLFAVDGFAEQRSADRAYVVGFQTAGTECGTYGLHLNSGDGTPLTCVPVGVRPAPGQRAGLRGFSDAQYDEVMTLAARLGSGGLSATEQRQIQDRVDQFAAGVPPADRPFPDSGLWGARRGWLGVGMLVASVLGFVALRWPTRRLQRWVAK
jgi:hypothetical protein